MTIDKVRAALEHAKACARNEYSMYVYEGALSELEGMVLVPVEPTSECTVCGKEISFTKHRGNM